jgi:hypothetical protein
MYPETNTLPKQHTPSLQGGVVDWLYKFFQFCIGVQIVIAAVVAVIPCLGVPAVEANVGYVAGGYIFEFQKVFEFGVVGNCPRLTIARRSRVFV